MSQFVPSTCRTLALALALLLCFGLLPQPAVQATIRSESSLVAQVVPSDDTGEVEALAGDDDRWSTGFGLPGTNGTILAIAVSGQNVYIGGSFTLVGSTVARNVARWDGSRWLALGDGVSNASGGGGSVAALAVVGETLYVGGAFEKAGATAAANIARWNGSAWSALGSGTNGAVNALQAIGSDVYVGGTFTTAGNLTVNGIARLAGTTWSALGSGVVNQAAKGTIYALASDGTNLYIGGQFTAVNGLTVSGVASWNGTAWSALGGGTGAQGIVYALVTDGPNLYIGGTFSAVNGVAAVNVARWSGGSWSAIGGITNPGSVAYVYGLTVAGGTLYAAGNFTAADGIAVERVARWNGSTWSAIGGVSGAWATLGEARAFALAPVGGGVLVGGSFRFAGDLALGNLALWNGSAWTPLGAEANRGADARVRALAVSGSTLYAGGEFDGVGTLRTTGVARWDGAAWQPMGGGISGGRLGRVLALAPSGADLYVGGDFEQAGGVAARSIARWDGSQWHALGGGFGSAFGVGEVYAIATLGSDVYAGGAFNSAGGNAIKALARWNGGAWSNVGGELKRTVFPAMDGRVFALAVRGTDLYVGGDFTMAGDVEVNGLARWDGSNWHAVGGGVASGRSVNALAVVGENLYVGGDFTTAGGVTVNGIARWDGSNWHALGAGFDYAVSTILPAEQGLYVGGSFTRVRDGIAANRVARWNGSAWSALGAGVGEPGVFGSSYADALAVLGNDLYVGGSFSRAGDKGAANIARWNTTAPPAGPVILNFANGKPGSFFTVSLNGFPANTSVTLTLNRRALGSVQTDGAGAATFVLNTQNLGPGVYTLVATAASGGAAVAAVTNGSANLTLEDAAPLRAKAPNIAVELVAPKGTPTRWVYLPLTRR